MSDQLRQEAIDDATDHLERVCETCDLEDIEYAAKHVALAAAHAGPEIAFAACKAIESLIYAAAEHGRGPEPETTPAIEVAWRCKTARDYWRHNQTPPDPLVTKTT